MLPRNFDQGLSSANEDPLPACDFTSETSLALIVPLVLTSARKVVASTARPTLDLASAISLALTEPFPFTSPTKMLIGIVTSAAGASVDVALFTPLRRTLIVCASAIFVSGMVTMLPATLTFPLHTPPEPTHPVPSVTWACGEPLTVTLPVNVTTIV